MVCPATQEEIGQAPLAAQSDVDAAVAAATRALTSDWAHWAPSRRAERNGTAGRRAGPACEADRGPGSTENGDADLAVQPDRSGRAPGCAALLRRAGPDERGRGAPPGCRRPARRHAGAARARGGGRCDRAVERPVAADVVQARARAGRRLHRGAKALAGDRPGCVPARRGRAGGWASPGRGEPRAWRRRGGGALGDPSRCPQGRVHRVDRGGSAHRRGMRSAAAAGHPGTGRQVRSDRSRRRRPRGHRAGPGGHLPAQQWPDTAT